MDLVSSTFQAMGREEAISFTDMPEDIRDKYQYFTQADMRKLRQAGYKPPFKDLETGITDYIKNYLDGAIIN